MADLPVPTTSADEVRRIADAVLARPEFAAAHPTWWQRLLRVLSDYLAGLGEAVGAGGSAVGTAVVVGLALVAILVVVRYTRTLRPDPRRDLAVGGQIGRSSADWLTDAAAAEERGQLREAVRCRYRALLAALSAAGLVEEVAGRTSGEYLAALTADVPAAAAAFADATRRFEDAWYGAVPVTSAEVSAVSDAARRTLADAGVRRPVAAGS